MKLGGFKNMFHISFSSPYRSERYPRAQVDWLKILLAFAGIYFVLIGLSVYFFLIIDRGTLYVSEVEESTSTPTVSRKDLEEAVKVLELKKSSLEGILVASS